MKNIKGFTLVEVLVVILVATLVLAMVGGTMLFIAKSTSNYIQQSQEIDMAKNIEKYLRHFQQEMVSLQDWKSLVDFQENGDIINGERVVFSNTGLVNFDIDQVDDTFIKCYMIYQSGRQFEFIIDVIR